ncbi:MAG TPA: PAAR domain-containing protein [Saprospiraceae bacterium]|nr:PAAR domain-containing protein [Saprospiraceae bacterium]HPI06216.1 PAAR domain-containing protein [Saprospiraceae bacterium]
MPQAVFIGCYHVCPAYDGDHPHTGGKALQGSANVCTGGKNLCRTGDALQCQSASPDTVIGGSATVFVNGLPAARLGDPCLHGGTLAEGAQNLFINS